MHKRILKNELQRCETFDMMFWRIPLNSLTKNLKLIDIIKFRIINNMCHERKISMEEILQGKNFQKR